MPHSAGAQGTLLILRRKKSDHEDWSICAISDADEPGEAIHTGIRHRDFDGVILVPITDENGWLYLDDSSEVAVRPLLLFYHGNEPELDEAIA